MLIDTHTHLYDEQFDDDRDMVIKRATDAGVGHFFLPAIDSESHEALFSLCRQYPEVCHPMMGLHPTSVNDNPNYLQELELVKQLLDEPPGGIRFCAIGEVGLDLYWSKDYEKEQTSAFRRQIEWSIEFGLPLVIHTREAWTEICAILWEYEGTGLHGVFHSFSGNLDHYRTIKHLGDFLFGISGSVTYKKSGLAEIIPQMDLADILLETDAPYLPPVPYRGKRNEPAYLTNICEKIAELKNISPEEVAHATSQNALRFFPI